MRTKENKVDITQVKVGMFWFEDDTFAFERILHKKIKAVVEHIKNGVIYGDLTVSELSEIKERLLNWDNAKSYLANLSYPCKKGEKIVWYNASTIRYILSHYAQVKKAFTLTNKMPRTDGYWSCEEYKEKYAFYASPQGRQCWKSKSHLFYIRPVLSLKVC